MDLTSVIGLVLTIAVVVVVMILDGGNPAELLAHPSAILLTLGGAATATIITSPLKLVTSIPKIFIKAFVSDKHNVEESIESLVIMADKARRDGLLALEEESKNITDEFLQKGVMMVVDGVDPSQVKAIMETQIEHMQSRHRAGAGFFASGGGFAPTFGIIGTVMGLIEVLKQLNDPDALARSIAGAFLATLWGLLSANLIYLPIAGKLKSKSEEEAAVRYMQLEGILAIQAGENPRVVRDKLNAFLAPNEMVTEEKSGASQTA